jgi:hypothetical protein
MAEECSGKLGQPVAIDLVRPSQAYDAGGKARAFSAMIKALAEAQAAGIDPGPAAWFGQRIVECGVRWFR